jgi:hypothetical protein
MSYTDNTSDPDPRIHLALQPGGNMMRKNMNILDRRVRAFLVAPAAVVIGMLIGPGSVGAIVFYVVAAIMLATSAAGSCPLYSVFGRRSHGRPPLTH